VNVGRELVNQNLEKLKGGGIRSKAVKAINDNMGGHVDQFAKGANPVSEGERPLTRTQGAQGVREKRGEINVLQGTLKGVSDKLKKEDGIRVPLVKVDPGRGDIRGPEPGGDQGRFPLGRLPQDENHSLVSVLFEEVMQARTWEDAG